MYRTATLIPTGMHSDEDGYRNGGWRTADLIPSGMHAVAEASSVASGLVAKLIARGIPEARARALVRRAVSRHAAGRAHQYPRRMGLGDDAPSATVSSEVLARATDTQTQHRDLIDRLAAATTDNFFALFGKVARPEV